MSSDAKFALLVAVLFVFSAMTDTDTDTDTAGHSRSHSQDLQTAYTAIKYQCYSHYKSANGCNKAVNLRDYLLSVSPAYYNQK